MLLTGPIEPTEMAIGLMERGGQITPCEPNFMGDVTLAMGRRREDETATDAPDIKENPLPEEGDIQDIRRQICSAPAY